MVIQRKCVTFAPDFETAVKVWNNPATKKRPFYLLIQRFEIYVDMIHSKPIRAASDLRQKFDSHSGRFWKAKVQKSIDLPKFCTNNLNK